MSKVYVPLIIDARDPYETFTFGAFVKKDDAVNALLAKLMEKEYISYDVYSDNIYNDMCNIEHDFIKDPEMKANVLLRIKEACTDRKSFLIFLTQKVDSDIDKLESVCDEFGDSDFNDGWKIRLDEFNLI